MKGSSENVHEEEDHVVVDKADVTDKIDVTEEVPNDDSDGNTNLGDDIVLSSCTVRDSVLAGGRLSDGNFVGPVVVVVEGAMVAVEGAVVVVEGAVVVAVEGAVVVAVEGAVVVVDKDVTMQMFLFLPMLFLLRHMMMTT